MRGKATGAIAIGRCGRYEGRASIERGMGRGRVLDMSPADPAALFELDYDGVHGEAVANLGGNFLNFAVALGTQNVLHLHRLDDG